MYTSTLADVYINPTRNKTLQTKCRQHVLQKEYKQNAGSILLSFMRAELWSDLFVHIVTMLQMFHNKRLKHPSEALAASDAQASEAPV